jgi:hypothetical protein
MKPSHMGVKGGYLTRFSDSRIIRLLKVHDRVDPRRRTYAMGIYAHVLDRWGIIYDQPLVLHQRQAGAAIEGVVRQTAVANVERLAVDTHGYTDFGMAIGKLLGFDLCPRLSHLRDRRLHVPREVSVPAVLASVVEPDVSLRQIEAGWYAVFADPQMPVTSTLLDQAHNAIERKLFAMKGFHHPGGSQPAFLTGLAHLYNLIPYQHRAKHAGKCGVEVEDGRVPTRDWFLNVQILTSGGFR